MNIIIPFIILILIVVVLSVTMAAFAWIVMKLFSRNKKFSFYLKPSIIISIVFLGLLSWQTYIKRGVRGRLKQPVDDIGNQYSPNLREAQLNKLKSENKISSEVYMDALRNLESQ